MATLMDRLKSLGIGVKSPEQLQREASPVMTAMMNRRAPTYDEIEEQKRLNREQGVWFPLFDGNLRSGERLQNINGITYKIPVGIEIPPNTTGFDLSQDMPVQPPENEMDYNGMPPPTARPAASPPRRDIVPPAPANMERPQDVLSFRPSPNFPARLPSSTEVPIPTRPDFTPERRQMPVPGPNLFTPPAMDPVVEKPNIDTDTILNSLMARYDALYSGEPPVAPEPRMPERRDFGVPVGPASPGLMSPPDIPAPNMPGVSEFDYGSARRLPHMSEEQLDEMFNEYLKSADENYLRKIGR
jgi:hypothetical protein